VGGLPLQRRMTGKGKPETVPREALARSDILTVAAGQATLSPNRPGSRAARIGEGMRHPV